MVTWEQAVAITLASVVLIVVPGPSVMFVVGRALSYGRGIAIASIVGNTIGCYLVCALIAIGLGPLLERYDLLFQAVKWGGILYLLYLGAQAFRHAGQELAAAEAAETATADERGDEAGGPGATQTKKTKKPVTPWGALRDGVIVGITNPKALVIFTVIVPQFIRPAAGSTTVQLLVLGLVPLLVGLICDSAWAVAAARARVWLSSSPKRMAMIGRIGGLSIIGVGVSIALAGDHR